MPHGSHGCSNGRVFAIDSGICYLTSLTVSCRVQVTAASRCNGVLSNLSHVASIIQLMTPPGPDLSMGKGWSGSPQAPLQLSSRCSMSRHLSCRQSLNHIGHCSQAFPASGCTKGKQAAPYRCKILVSRIETFSHPRPRLVAPGPSLRNWQGMSTSHLCLSHLPLSALRTCVQEVQVVQARTPMLKSQRCIRVID